jgi:hypothetical protein
LFAEIIPVEVAAQLAVNPNIIRLEVSSPLAKTPLERTATISLGDVTIDKLKCLSSVSWIKTNSTGLNDHEVLLFLEISPPDSISRCFEMVGDVAISARADAPPIKLQVILFHAIRHRVVPEILETSRISSVVKVSLQPISSPSGVFSHVDLLTAPEGVRVTLDKLAGDLIELQVTVPPSLPRGFHAVRCMVYSKADSTGELIASPVQFALRQQ